MELARAGEVLGAARTWRVVRHAVTAAPETAGGRSTRSTPTPAPLARRLETPLVGTSRELREIADAFERAAAEGRPSPRHGLRRARGRQDPTRRREPRSASGSWRLPPSAAAVRLRRRRPTRRSARCSLHWAARRRGLDPRAPRADDGAQLAEQLAAAVGLAAGTAHTEDTALATRRCSPASRGSAHCCSSSRTSTGPPPRSSTSWSRSSSSPGALLVLCLARPDLLEVRPHWGGGRLSSSAILLDALTPPERRRCSTGSARPSARHPGASAILAVAEGNPLFIEQLLAVALEGDSDALPDSIQTLLAARLDRLDELDRAVVQAAAVCGTSFTTEDVAALVDGDAAASLMTLVRRELIRPGEAGTPAAKAGRSGTASSATSPTGAPEAAAGRAARALGRCGWRARERR